MTLTDDSHALNAASSSNPRPLRPGPSDDDVDINFNLQSKSQNFKSLAKLISTTPRIELPPVGSPQIASSPDESHPSSSSAPTDGDSLPSGTTTEEHGLSSPDQSSDSSTEEYHPSSSGTTTEEHGLSSPDQSSDSSTEEYHPSSSGSTTDSEEYYPSSSDQSSNAGPSTNPPPRAKRPRPEENEAESFLSKIVKGKGKFKRRFSGSGAAAQGDLQGTFNSRAYVTTSSLPLLSTNNRSHEHPDILINR
jgi:hypothetical protein